MKRNGTKHMESGKKRLPFPFFYIEPIATPQNQPILQLTLNEVDLFPWLQSGSGISNKSQEKIFSWAKKGVYRGEKKILSSKGESEGPCRGIFLNISVTATQTHHARKFRLAAVQPKRFCRDTGQMKTSTRQHRFKTMAQQYQTGENTMTNNKHVSKDLNTPPKFHIAPGKRWLERYCPFGMAYFHGRAVKLPGSSSKK